MRSLLRITEENRKWWILLAMTSTSSMMFLDQTILGVTLPTIHEALNASSLEVQWIVNAYILTLATLVLAMGRFCDVFGSRTIYFIGTLLFAVASALCGMSMNAAWFITSRVLQGIGGAMLYPATTSIVFGSFPSRERGRAMGLFVSIGAILLSLGPLLGGLFTEYLTWRYVFWINLPIALIGIFLTLLSVPPIYNKNPPILRPASYILFASGVALLILSLMNGGDWGWHAPITLTLFASSFFFFILFFLRNSRLSTPFFDFTLFKRPVFLAGVLSTSSNQFILMVTIFWAMYFQTSLGYSPLKAGLLTLITNIPVLIAAPISGTWLDKKGPKQPVVTGFCCILFALLWFALFAEHRSVTYLFPSLFFLGWGLPLVFTPAGTSTITQAPLEKRGLAIGINLTIRQFGGTLGLALFSSLFLQTQLFRMNALLKSAGVRTLSAHQFDGLLSKAPSALEALQALPKATQTIVIQSAREATVTAFSAINLLGAFVAIFGLIAAATLFKKVWHRENPKSPTQS